MVAILCDGCGQTVYRLQRRRLNKSGRVFCTITCRNKHYGPRQPLWDRFWSKVQQQDECWLWTASVLSSGYGCVRVNGKTRTAHTLAWELTCGLIPCGLFVCHTCDVRRCCRPSHLFLGTAQDNNDDGRRKGRITSAKHPASGESHPSAKLSDDDVRNIRARYPSERQSALARAFHVTQAQIWNIVNGYQRKAAV